MKREHLEAALALWRYAVDSARYLFDGADPVGRCAERIVAALRDVAPDSLTRTQIRDLFGRHGSDVEQALRSIEARGLGHREKRATAGRPVECWFAATKATEATKGSRSTGGDPSVASVAPRGEMPLLNSNGYPVAWDEDQP